MEMIWSWQLSSHNKNNPNTKKSHHRSMYGAPIANYVLNGDVVNNHKININPRKFGENFWHIPQSDTLCVDAK